MKITAEVREFAAKQNAAADTFLAAYPPRHGGEERSLSGGQASIGADHSQHGGGSPLHALTSDQAEAGMASMSEVFKEKGGEIYLPAVEQARTPV